MRGQEKPKRWLLEISALILFAAAARSGAQPASPISSSPTAPELQKGEEIVITGSRIPRRNLTSLSPISLVSKQEVRLEGAVLTETLINALPQVVPDQGMFLSNGATGTAAVDLRGFGASRTLVLVNGRRLLPGDATYAAADINFIPSSLISRVEVLTGGASSVYGSDAIAGVANFILDRRLDGLRIDGQASFYQHDNRNKSGIGSLIEDSGFSSPTGNTVDGGIQDINAAYGLAFAHGRGHVTVYGGYRQSSGFTQDTRDYSSCAVTAADLEEPVFCGGSTTSAAGTFVIPNFGLRLHATPNRTFAPRPSFFNFAPYNYYQRPDRRYTTGVFADLELSDAFKPYFEGMYMDDKTVAQIAPSGDFGVTNRINCDNPLLSDQERGLVCFDGNYIGQRPVFDDDGNLIEIIGTPTGPYLQAGLRIHAAQRRGWPSDRHIPAPRSPLGRRSQGRAGARSVLRRQLYLRPGSPETDPHQRFPDEPNCTRARRRDRPFDWAASVPFLPQRPRSRLRALGRVCRGRGLAGSAGVSRRDDAAVRRS